MFLILGGVAITGLVLVMGTTRRLFTDDDRLVPLVRTTMRDLEDVAADRPRREEPEVPSGTCPPAP